MNGAAAGVFLKLAFPPGKQLNQFAGVESLAGIKVGLITGTGKAVPRAYQLAVITAIHTVTNQRTQLLRNGVAQLDCQVGNTQACIQFVGCDDGMGGAGIDAGATAAAMIFARLVNLQGQVSVQLADKKPRAGLLVDQVGVFANPAKAGFLCQRLFKYRCAVGEGAIAKRSCQGFNFVGQLLQPFADDLVIIAAQRVA